MKITFVITTLFAMAIIGAGSARAASDSPATPAAVNASLARMPLAFTENQG